MLACRNLLGEPEPSTAFGASQTGPSHNTSPSLLCAMDRVSITFLPRGHTASNKFRQELHFLQDLDVLFVAVMDLFPREDHVLPAQRQLAESSLQRAEPAEGVREDEGEVSRDGLEAGVAQQPAGVARP